MAKDYIIYFERDCDVYSKRVSATSLEELNLLVDKERHSNTTIILVKGV